MKCPRCSLELISRDIEGFTVLCCSGCAGISLKQRNLNQLLGRLCKSVSHRLSANSIVRKVIDLGSIKWCPECGSRTENYGYMESNKVLLDYCDNCNAVWLDPFELLTMVDMFAISKHHSEYLKKTFYEGTDLMTPYANTQKAMAGMVWGALGVDWLGI